MRLWIRRKDIISATIGSIGAVIIWIVHTDDPLSVYFIENYRQVEIAKRAEVKKWRLIATALEYYSNSPLEQKKGSNPDEGCDEFLDTDQESYLEHHYLNHCQKSSDCKCGWQYYQLSEEDELE